MTEQSEHCMSKSNPIIVKGMQCDIEYLQEQRGLPTDITANDNIADAQK